MWADGIGAAKDATTIGSCIVQTAKKIFSYCCICKKQKIDLTKSTEVIYSLNDLLKEFNGPGYVMKEAKRLAEDSLKKAGCCCKCVKAFCCCCTCCCDCTNQEELEKNIKDLEKSAIDEAAFFFKMHFKNCKNVEDYAKNIEGKTDSLKLSALKDMLSYILEKCGNVLSKEQKSKLDKFINSDFSSNNKISHINVLPKQLNNSKKNFNNSQDIMIYENKTAVELAMNILNKKNEEQKDEKNE